MATETNEPSNPVDPILDVLVFAPLGLALESVNLFPKLVERGRTEVNNARVIGGFAYDKAKSEATGAAEGIDGVVPRLVTELVRSVFPPSTPAEKASPPKNPPSATKTPDPGVSDEKTERDPAETTKPKAKATASSQKPTKKSPAKKKPTKKKPTKKRPAKKSPAKKSAPSKRAATKATPDTVPVAADLAIPGYDELSASQVVPMLRGLRASELRHIQRYEVANRNRKTILGRVAQLLA